MSRQWNVKRAVLLKYESIETFLSQMKFARSRRNKYVDEANLTDAIRNLSTVNVIVEIEFANSAIHVMQSYVRALEEEEKRRQLESNVIQKYLFNLLMFFLFRQLLKRYF